MKALFTDAEFYSPEKLRGDTLAVDNGHIVEIGTKAGLAGLSRRGFKKISLKGKTVVPGFIDAHLHLLSIGYDLSNVNLNNLETLDKVLAKIARAAKNLPAEQWLVGRGWDKNLWGDDFPDKAALDKVCPDNPARFFSKDGHCLWVNSKALAVCEIDSSTPEPEGGSIKHGADGAPDGILFENAADLVTKKIKDFSIDYKLKALKKSINHLNSLGITGVGDCDWYTHRLGLFQDAFDKGFLSLRIFMMLSPKDIDAAGQLGIRTGFGDNFITIGALKLFMDGSLGSQTAWMHHPYENQPANFGISTMSDDQLEMYFEKTHLNGISLAVHAIGDRANSELLNFFAKKYAVSKKLGLKHRIEHAQLLDKNDIGKFKKYDIAASVQPIHIIADIDMADKYWGKRTKYAYPFASLLKQGAVVGFGSDAPVENPNPFLGIYGAVARKRSDDDRRAWYDEQCLSVRQALRAYTKGSAEICSWAGQAGDLRVGARADFAILSDNLFKVSSEELPKIKVLATVVNGDFVYQDKAFKI